METEIGGKFCSRYIFVKKVIFTFVNHQLTGKSITTTLVSKDFSYLQGADATFISAVTLQFRTVGFFRLIS